MLLLLIAAFWPFVGEVADDTVVARAQTGAVVVEITAQRLRAYAQAHPDRSPRALAEELIEFELMAAEAERRGLASEPTVERAAAQAMVQRLLMTDFEPKWTPEALPESMVRQSYDRNRGIFVRPEIRDADHLLATIDGARPTDPQVDAASRVLLEEIRADLMANPAADRDTFRARADQYQAQAEALGITLKAEKLPFFALKGAMVAPFSEAVFALEKPGTLTPVFPTRFGWHLARVSTIKPAVNRSFEAAEAEIRAKIVPEVRPHQFRQRTETLAREKGALLDPGPLERQSKAQGLDEQ